MLENDRRNVSGKPRRQTRATLAYDRVMFFSDFFRRLESDRRLFALPPVRRNRVYVRPRAEDASAEPVKFPRPTAAKKGKIGIVSAIRNSGIRSSPFANKRRLPSHGWDHKIDLESIEADATSNAQPSQNQLSSVSRPLASSSLLLKQTRQFPDEAAKTNNANVGHGSSTAVRPNAESAFTGVTKHSAKMRRRLKRKQRKRSATTSEGIEGGIPDTSTSSSEDGTPSQRADDSSRRGSKKEPRSSTEHHRPTIAITDAAAITPHTPESSQKSREDIDGVLHSCINRSPREIEPKLVKSTMKDKKPMPSTSAPRGKTIIEILSHIGEQTPSYPNDASTSSKPDELGNLEEDCSVSIIVEELEDGRGTVGGLDSKLQAITSQLTHAAVMEKKDKSADYFGTMATSVEHGRPSSPASSSRLSVTKTIGDGVLLKRSHSCGEMRRRMVLTEWEVVTTTNTEVIVTETGPTSQQMEKGASSDNETSGGNVKSGLLSETRDHDGSAHDSRRQTLGLDKNSAGHRRSKSSDDRTRKHIHAATTAEIQTSNNLNDTSDCLISSTEQNEECDHKTAELAKRDDDSKTDTAIQQSPQSSEESNTKPSVSDLPLLETRVAVVRDFSTVTELPHSGSEQTIATYTLSKSDLVRSGGAKREERWAMGLDADLVLDYMVVDVVEKIRLRAAGNGVSDQDSEDPDDQEQPNKSADEQNSVTDCSEVMLPEQKSNNNEASLREEVEVSSVAPHRVQCQPTESESGIADHQQNTCSDTVNNVVVRDIDGSVAERQETQDIMACPVETIRDDPTFVDRQANAAGNVSQPRAKEDEDSEEKEADEAENREAECGGTEEKGMTELNYSIVEKTGHVYEESGNTLQDVEQLNGENLTDGQLLRGSVDDDCLSPLGGELHLTDTATCGSEPRVDSSNLLDPKIYPSMTAAADTEIKSGSNRTNDGCTVGETGHGEKLADEEQVMPVTINVGMMANRQDSTTEYRISDVEVMFKAETLSMLGDEEQNEAEPGPPATSSDHTQRAEGSLTVTSTMTADDMDDLENKTVCVSAATGTSDYENSENADDPVRSPTSTLEGTAQTLKT